MIEEILKENTNLKLNKTMINYLKELELYIPINLRNNYYNNLKTVRVIYNKEIKDNNKIAIGKYNHKENTINLNSANLIKDMQKYNIEKEEILKSVEQVFLHEFVHMASSHYDKNTNTLITGFEKNGSITNTALNEGMTELISLSIVKPKYQVLTEYVFEHQLANQISLIIGQSKMLEAYFSGTETKIIEESLNDLGKETNIPSDYTHDLLREIEQVNIFKYSEHTQDCLANSQNMLLSYLDIKLNVLQKDNKQNEIDNIIKAYSQCLITPEKLSKEEKEIYINLDKNLIYFNKIVNKYKNIIDTNSKKR